MTIMLSYVDAILNMDGQVVILQVFVLINKTDCWLISCKFWLAQCISLF